MDSLSQIALGAAVGTAVLGRRVGAKAAVWGAVCGTLPDLDVLISHGDPVRDFTFHRAESHALFWLSKNHSLKKVVEEVKKASSSWMKADGTRDAEFYWQDGYAAFSVSQSNVEDVKRYIRNQREHHRKMTFQDELRALFERHQIEYDERYVWD